MCNPVTMRHPEVLLDKGVHLGYEWEVTYNRIGYRCGYVRIPAGHPWHGKDYDDVEPHPEVHGGLTFAEPDADCGKGGEDNAWWLGYDAAHYMDAPDPILPGYDRTAEGMGLIGAHGTIKTTAYMVAECKRLIEQAAEAAGAVEV